MTEPVKEGWGMPFESKKWHYFVDTRSLCGSWGFYQGALEQGDDDSPGNCAACRKRLKARKAGAWLKEKRQHDL